MKLVAMSDFHNYFPSQLPDGDLLVIAGDATMSGTHAEMQQLHDWLMQQVVRFTYGVAFLAGNHDMMLDNSESAMGKAYIIESGARYLQDEMFELAGKRFYFSPWIPMIGDEPYWAFEARRGNEIAEKWKLIPEGLDVLVTHGPPYKMLDWEDGWRGKRHWGCWDLAHRLSVMKSPPRHHIFGHVHPDKPGQAVWRGSHEQGHRISYHNVCIMNNAYIPTWEPQVIEI